MHQLASWFGLIGVLTGALPTATGEPVPRSWYLHDCTVKVTASLIASDDHEVTLLDHADKQSRYSIDELSSADRAYLKGFAQSGAAAGYLNRSPAAGRTDLLNAIADSLIEHGVNQDTTRSLTRSDCQSGWQGPGALVGRWVEIRGIPYRVEAARQDESGWSDIILVSTDGNRRAALPEFASEMRLLDATPGRSRYGAKLVDDGRFVRRGPPTKSPYSADYQWKHELIYDSTRMRWTDSQAAKASQLFTSAKKSWAACEHLEKFASARWSVHRGTEAFEQGLLDVAHRRYGEAITLAPQYAYAHLCRGLTARQLKRGDAEQGFSEAIRLGTADLDRGQDRTRTVLAAFRERASLRSSVARHDEAIVDARQAMKLNPNKSDLSYQRLLTTVRRNAAVDMERTAQSLLAPAVGGAELADSGFEAAIATYSKARAYSPDRAKKHQLLTLLVGTETRFAQQTLRKAGSAYDGGQYEDAVGLARKAVQRNPIAADASYEGKLLRYQRGALEHFSRVVNEALKERSLDQALSAAEAAVRVAPEEQAATVRNQLAECCLQSAQLSLSDKEFTKCIELATRCLAIRSEDVSALTYRARASYFVQDFGKVIEDLSKVEALGSAVADTYYLRGVSEFYHWLNEQAPGKRGDRELANAERDLSLAITKGAISGGLYYCRCRVHIAQGSLEKALADIDSAILRERDAEYYLLRAALLIDFVQLDKADRDVTTALRIEPQSQRASLLRARIVQLRAASAKDDEYYFNRDNLPTALAAYSFAGVARIGKWTVGASILRSSSIEEALTKGTITALAALGEWGADELAIQLVFPNLTGMKRAALMRVVTKFRNAVIDFYIFGVQPVGLLRPVLMTGAEVLAFDVLANFIDKELPGFGASMQCAEVLSGMAHAVKKSK